MKRDMCTKFHNLENFDDLKMLSFVYLSHQWLLQTNYLGDQELNWLELYKFKNSKNKKIIAFQNSYPCMMKTMHKE